MSNQFFGQQTLTAQYFRPQYLHGAGGTPTQDGKSGYWRLFYYQLQEAELKKENEQKQGQETSERKVEVTQAKPVAAAGKPVRQLVQLETYEKPDFKRKAIYTQPTKTEAQLPRVVASVDWELDTMYKEFAPRIIAWQIQEQQKVEAANDADMRIRLLLLAA